jgi:hypothetical protein
MGREAEDANLERSNNPGFDIKSIDRNSGSIRYIEVKGLGSSWEKSEFVTMSARQLLENFNQADNYWLYVIENVDQPEEHWVLYGINNLAGIVANISVDWHWAQRAVEQFPSKVEVLQIGDKVRFGNDFGEIIRVPLDSNSTRYLVGTQDGVEKWVQEIKLRKIDDYPNSE